MYTYNAKLVRVVDGDTAYLEVDCGFHLKFTHSFRLLGINAPEIKTGEPGLKAKLHLESLLVAKALRITTAKADSFGRWLATIYIPELQESVNQKMVADGFAVAFMV